VNSPLKIATFNAENFYMLLDRDYSPEEFGMVSDADYKAMNKSIYNPNKDLYKIAAIAAIILEEDFDFVGLCEVGGIETLANFNNHFLGNRYDFFLHQDNSSRGIFVGALVKKGRFAAATARSMPGMFSRNLLEVSLSVDGVDMMFFVVHLKSQYGQDRGIEKRLQEIRQLCGMVGLQNCVVMGDFNGIMIRGQNQFEYDAFLELPFRDVLEALDVPAGARFSHFYFGAGKPSFNQLDYIFCSDDMAVVDGGMIVDMVPLNHAQRRRLPSDHIFLKATIAPSGTDR